MTSADKPALNAAILEGIDRNGGDLRRWPDRVLAKQAGEAALADRDIRASLDTARALDHGLAAVRESLDEEILVSGAADRIAAATSAALAPRPFGGWRWVAAVAVIVSAAGLGSIADLRLGALGSEAPVNVVVLDPLVFGPIANDDR
jgi:hypothetical protein